MKPVTGAGCARGVDGARPRFRVRMAMGGPGSAAQQRSLASLPAACTGPLGLVGARPPGVAMPGPTFTTVLADALPHPWALPPHAVATTVHARLP
jgi:hypothetical protein